MQHFSIYIAGAGELDGTYQDVAATEVDTAVKRVLSGVEAAKLRGQRVAAARQVTRNRAQLEPGSKITIEITRHKLRRQS